MRRAFAGTKFTVHEARLQIRQGGQLHIIRFSSEHLRMLLSVVLDAVAHMTTLDDMSVDGLPVNATFRWVPPPDFDHGHDRHVYAHHDVTPAICAMAGPGARWWRCEDGVVALPRVTAHAVIAESLRYLYDLRTPHRLLRHLGRCEISIKFLDGHTWTIDSELDSGNEEICIYQQRRPFQKMQTTTAIAIATKKKGM